MQILFGFMNPDRFIGQRVPSIFSLYEKQVLWSQPVGHNFSCIAHVVEDSTLNLRVQGLFPMSEILNSSEHLSLVTDQKKNQMKIATEKGF